MMPNSPENKGIVDFYIHPQTTEELSDLVKKVNGVPAHYTFVFESPDYKIPYETTVMVEGTSLSDANKNAMFEISRRGFNITRMELTLKRVQNKYYSGNNIPVKG